MGKNYIWAAGKNLLRGEPQLFCRKIFIFETLVQIKK